jgi:SAM-dependent methyltransferase
MMSDGRIICPSCEIPLDLNGRGYVCSKCHKIFITEGRIISFIHGGNTQEGFDRSYFDDLIEAEKKHFWFQNRNKLIIYFIKKYCKEIVRKSHRMLEIGCGNGNVLSFLNKNEINCEGGDLFIEGLQHCQNRVDVPLYQIDALNLPFRDYFDIIGLFDVIEHVEDDGAVLKEVYKALKQNGKILITVPAGKKLWGRYDELAFHKRRYSYNELKDHLERADFEVEKISYFGFFLYPILYFFRQFNEIKYRKLSNREFLKKEIRINPFVNKIFLWISVIEMLFMRFISFPFGSTLIAIASK